MQIKKGQDRIVFIFPLIGIVIKFPIIHFFRVFRRTYCVLRGDGKNKKEKWEWIKEHLTYPIEAYFGFKGLLFRGLVANWREFWFYLKTRHSFLQPTYFSLFGLLNIQRYDEPCRLQNVDLWCQLYEMTNGQVFDDSHHFENPHNFCFHNGKLRMLDYGSRRTWGVISNYGAKIIEHFNPAYSWEEEKKK